MDKLHDTHKLLVENARAAEADLRKTETLAERIYVRLALFSFTERGGMAEPEHVMADLADRAYRYAEAFFDTDLDGTAALQRALSERKMLFSYHYRLLEDAAKKSGKPFSCADLERSAWAGVDADLGPVS